MKRLLKIPIPQAQAALLHLTDKQTAELFRGLLHQAAGESYTQTDPIVQTLIAVLSASDNNRKTACASKADTQPTHTKLTADQAVRKKSPEEQDPYTAQAQKAFEKKLDALDVPLKECDKEHHKDSDKEKNDDKEKPRSYQPVKKVEKSKRRVRVEEKEINKEKEERNEEKKKEERRIPSSLSPSKTEKYISDIRRSLKNGSITNKLTDAERKRLSELDRVKDIRDISKVDMEILEKAEVIDLRALVLTLRCYNEAMTEMIPEYAVSQNRLRKAKEVFEYALETDAPLPYLFERASESSFLCGYKSFRGADYDWLMREDHMDKVLSGYYDDYRARRN